MPLTLMLVALFALSFMALLFGVPNAADVVVWTVALGVPIALVEGLLFSLGQIRLGRRK